MPLTDLVDEELRVQALAEQAALHVGERDDDRVDLTALDLMPEVVEGQHAGDPKRLLPSVVSPLDRSRTNGRE